MKTRIKNSFGRPALFALGMVLLSFISPAGGDSFTIHLNNKLVLQQYLHSEKAVKNIHLDRSNINDELRISFSHCGQVGKKRSITLKDGQNKILKQWSYADNNSSMVCRVKEIFDYKKTNTTLQLFYASGEMPEGRVLASIVTDYSATAKN